MKNKFRTEHFNTRNLHFLCAECGSLIQSLLHEKPQNASDVPGSYFIPLVFMKVPYDRFTLLVLCLRILLHFVQPLAHSPTCFTFYSMILTPLP